MQDNNSPRTLAPGTIDQVRRNIGPIDPSEALALQKKLGGEILQERSTAPSIPVKKQTSTPRRETIRASGLSSSDIAAKSAALTATSHNKSAPNVNKIVSSTVKKMKTEEELPEITPQDLKLMNKLMMNPEYDIKPNYGFFSFLLMMSKNKEKLNKSYGEYNVKKHVDHLQSFIGCIKTFIQLSPDTYKAKIATGSELKFKFLRTVGKWTMRDIKVLSIDLAERSSELSVAMMIPYVKAVYKQLITIYYIGDQQIPAIIKEIFADITIYPDSDKKKMQNLAKQGITEWLYVYNQIIKGLYPLLMRMCSSEYIEFPRFFTVKIADILKFLGLTKFDLLLPEKKKKEVPEEVKKEKQAEARKKLEENRHVAGVKDELVVTGLKILEQLFPQAGFMSLEKNPDMYPYFQPLYKFADGFNMLSPKNPLQVTIVLLKITEDLLQGCRNIEFNIKADEKLAELNDNFSEAMADWAAYREDLFDKKYGDYFRGLVNSVYSQPDYANSQYGKEVLTNIYWRTKYYFLPNFQFQQLILKKPQNDCPYKPLFMRTDYMRTVLTTIVRRIDENAEKKGAVLGVLNPWDRYSFDLSNIVSKRMDVLLGAKKQVDTSATNANLIKYTLCVISVLDWWINNPASPAYLCDSKNIYRISQKDGGPEFSAPERNDQNQLFAESVKRAIAARKNNPQK